MKEVKIQLPDPPTGFGEPEWRPLFLPIDERDYVLIGEVWWKARDVVTTGGGWYLVVRKIA